MKRFALLLPTLAVAILPFAASAHQHASYIIGGVQYDFMIGSLNEPVAVDDKTGVDLRVTSGGHMAVAEDGDAEAAGGTPAAGLENDLKVELIAGEQKKVLALSPVFNAPGSYKAAFYPTVATTLSYRFFGSINKTPIDITFTCRAEGATAADEGEKEISEGVKQLAKGGGFGCPAEKESLGFPQESAAIASTVDTAQSAQAQGQFGIALGAISLVVGGFALMRGRRS